MTLTDNATPFIPAVLRAAPAVVARYDVGADAAVTLLHQSENTMLLVDDASRGHKLVLRVHSQRLTYHTAASIASELQWMRALARDSDVVVPVPMAARDGSLVQTMTAPDLDCPRHAVMFTFLAGAEPSEDNLLGMFPVLGAVTARMHRHARRWQRPASFTRHHWDGAAVLGDAPLWGRWREGMGVGPAERAVLDRLAATLGRRLEKLGRAPEIYGLVHADMRLANLLVEGTSPKVIDFDDCGFSWFLYDLATAVSFLQHKPFADALIAAWLDGYRRVEAVPPVLEAEIPTIVLLRRMAEIAWLGTRRHLAFAQSLGPAFTTDSCRLAEDYLVRFG